METEIKLLIDHKPQYRTLATGSASVVNRERLAESGAGRWNTVQIPTLSFFESGVSGWNRDRVPDFESRAAG